MQLRIRGGYRRSGSKDLNIRLANRVLLLQTEMHTFLNVLYSFSLDRPSSLGPVVPFLRFLRVTALVKTSRTPRLCLFVYVSVKSDEMSLRWSTHSKHARWSSRPARGMSCTQQHWDLSSSVGHFDIPYRIKNVERTNTSFDVWEETQGCSITHDIACSCLQQWF